MTRDLTVGRPEGLLWRFCLPLFGSILFQQLYNIADSLVAGKFLGEGALAAVGNSYEITLIFLAFATGCNIGCSVLVSRLFGAKRLGDMKTGVFTVMLFSVALCGAMIPAPDRHAGEYLRRFMGVSAHLRAGVAIPLFL